MVCKGLEETEPVGLNPCKPERRTLMTATVREFCRAYGINENAENIAELIYSALVDGDEYRSIREVIRKEPEIKTPIPDRNP